MKRRLTSAIVIIMLAGCSGRGETPSLIPASSSFGAGSSPAVTQHYAHEPNRGPLPAISEADIDNHIDARLPTHDRDVMRKLMARMHPADRYNVMFFD